MEEAEKTREQLLCALMALRQRIAPLEVTSTMRQEVAAQGYQELERQRSGTFPSGLIVALNNALTAMLGYIALALYDVSFDSVAWHRLWHAVAAGRCVEHLVQQPITLCPHSEQTPDSL